MIPYVYYYITFNTLLNPVLGYLDGRMFLPRFVPPANPPSPPPGFPEVTVTSVSLPPFVSRRGLSNTNQRLSLLKRETDQRECVRWHGISFTEPDPTGSRPSVLNGGKGRTEKKREREHLCRRQGHIFRGNPDTVQAK